MVIRALVDLIQPHDDLHVVNTINLITNNSSQHTAQKTKDGVT
jgi:hypothetical protein